MVKKLTIIVPLLVLALMATAAHSLTTPPSAADPEVKKLLLMMDRDRNGKVSRAEFMAFMTAEFERLDVNRDGELDVNELTALRVSSKHPGGGSK
jgi:Ca2+-binding EF-hand superfamily protein